MNILVTGGAGFIGSNFIRYLLRQDDQDIRVINVDKLTYAGNLENLKDIENDPRYSFIKADIADESAMKEVFNRSIDIVYNFAAESHVDRSIMDPTAFIHTDIFGAYVLLELSRQKGIKKFIQISTDEVYGSIDQGSFKETDPLMPRNPYAASKTGADRLAYSYWATYQLPVIITRASNNYGPYQYPEKFISLMVTNLVEGESIPVYGDGTNIRDWLYVEDHCAALWFILKKGEEGEVYNVGGGNEKQNIEITRLILNYLNKPESCIRFVKDRLGHDKRYSLDTQKLRKLGWVPQASFDDFIKKTVDWYVNHPDWWKKIKSGEYLEYYKSQYEKR